MFFLDLNLFFFHHTNHLYILLFINTNFINILSQHFSVCAQHESARPFGRAAERDRRLFGSARHATVGTVAQDCASRTVGQFLRSTLYTFRTKTTATIFDAGGGVCICPLTEASLGDGVFLSPEACNGMVSLGTDCNARIDMVRWRWWWCVVQCFGTCLMWWAQFFFYFLFFISV